MQLWRLALPMIVLQWLAVAASVIDSRFLAETNHLALAAMAISYRYYLLVLLFSAGVQMAMAVRMAAAKDCDRSKVLAAAGVFCLLLAIPTAALLYCCPWILLRLNINHSLLNLLTPYFHVLALASVFLWLSGLWRQALLSFYKQKIISYLAIVYFIMHVGCSYLLVFGKYGFPILGLKGVAYSELLSLATVTVIAGVILNKHYKLFNFLALKWDNFYLQWKKSWPVSMLWLNEMLAMLIIVMIIAKIGVDALAAYQMVSQLDLLLLMIPYATSMACAVVFAKTSNIYKQMNYLKQALYIVLLPMLIASILFLLFPQQVLHAFFNPKKLSILPLAAKLLMITAVAHLFNSLRKILVGCLRGLGDIHIPLVISALSFWGIGVLGALLMHKFMHLGVVEIWLMLALAMVTGAAAMSFRFRYIYNKNAINMLEQNFSA